MYGIFTYMWLIFMVNVGKYTIHGSYGLCFGDESHCFGAHKRMDCFFDWISFEFLPRQLSHVLWVSKFQCGAQSMKTSLGLLVPHVLLVLCSRPPHFWDFEVFFLIFPILKRGGNHVYHWMVSQGSKPKVDSWWNHILRHHMYILDRPTSTHPSDSDQRMPSTPFMLVYSTLVSLFGWSSPLVYGLFAEDTVCHFQNWFT